MIPGQLNSAVLAASGFGGFGGTAPSSLTGLIGWWDAQVFASLTISSGTVTASADQSGAANNLTGVGSPTYNATSFNGKPGIVYGSTEGDGLINSSFALGTGNTLTLFGVFQMNSPTFGIGTFAHLFGYTASGQTNTTDNAPSFGVLRDNNTSNMRFQRNNVFINPAFGYDAPHRLIITVKSDGTWDEYVDGVATTSSQTAANWGSPGYFGLGFSQNNSGVFNQFGGVIGEAGIATAWHDATTVASLDTYLKNKWGL